MKNIKSSGNSLDDSDLEKAQGGITYIVEPDGPFLIQLFRDYGVYDENGKLLKTFFWHKDAVKYAIQREEELGNDPHGGHGDFVRFACDKRSQFEKKIKDNESTPYYSPILQ